jgi:excisionase family DNA binding protein
MDSATENEVMNVDEVAAFLRINRNTVYNAVNTRRIPHQRLGRRILFSRSALLQWLAGRMGEIATTNASNRERTRAKLQGRPSPTVSSGFVPVAGRRSSAQIEALKKIVMQAVEDEPLKGAQHYAIVLRTTTYEVGTILGRLVVDGRLSRIGHGRAAIYRPS